MPKGSLLEPFRSKFLVRWLKDMTGAGSKLRGYVAHRPKLMAAALKIYALAHDTQFTARDGKVELRRDNRSILLRTSHMVYAKEVIDFFDFYYNAIERHDRHAGGRTCADFSEERDHNLTGWDLFDVRLPSLPEPMETVRHYLELGELSEGDSVIDLGAYAAITTMAFQEAVGTQGKVVGVEADSFNLASAQCNLKRYAMLRGNSPEVLNFAIWSERGEVPFCAEGGLGSAVSELLERSESPAIKVPAMTLGDLVSMTKMERVDLIKADIEGAEYAAFSDKKFFAKFRPRLVFEQASSANLAAKTELLGELLRGYGYEIHAVPQHGSELNLVVCRA